MRTSHVIAALLLLLVPCSSVNGQILPSLGGERSGTSGFQFLKIPVDARGAALGESVVASSNDPGGLLWNPASVAGLGGIQASFQHTAYFVDVTLDYAAVTWRPSSRGLAFGLSIQTMNSGEMDVTTEFQPEGTGQTFRLLDVGLGLTLAQQLTDLFSYGVTTKYIEESVAGLTARTVVFDLGMQYRVGETGATMAVSVRNFGLDGQPKGTLARRVIDEDPVLLESSFESMTPPTTFHLALAYRVFEPGAEQQLRLSSQLNNPSDNAENWNLGAEYGWRETVFFRAGYRFGVEEFTTPSLGAGVKAPLSGRTVRLDYGFNRLERLGNVHRFGMALSI